MATYAIISLGGKQYRVREGERLLVDRLTTGEGKTFHPDVLFTGGDGTNQFLYLDVKDDKGNVTNWGFSASPPGMLQRRGITKNSLKLGDVLTITGHRAKDGSNNASGNVVTFPDGRDARIGQDQALNPTEAGQKQ